MKNNRISIFAAVALMSICGISGAQQRADSTAIQASTRGGTACVSLDGVKIDGSAGTPKAAPYYGGNWFGSVAEVEAKFRPIFPSANTMVWPQGNQCFTCTPGTKVTSCSDPNEIGSITVTTTCTASGPVDSPPVNTCSTPPQQPSGGQSTPTTADPEPATCGPDYPGSNVCAALPGMDGYTGTATFMRDGCTGYVIASTINSAGCTPPASGGEVVTSDPCVAVVADDNPYACPSPKVGTYQIFRCRRQSGLLEYQYDTMSLCANPAAQVDSGSGGTTTTSCATEGQECGRVEAEGPRCEVMFPGQNLTGTTTIWNVSKINSSCECRFHHTEDGTKNCSLPVVIDPNDGKNVPAPSCPEESHMDFGPPIHIARLLGFFQTSTDLCFITTTTYSADCAQSVKTYSVCEN